MPACCRPQTTPSVLELDWTKHLPQTGTTQSNLKFSSEIDTTTRAPEAGGSGHFHDATVLAQQPKRMFLKSSKFAKIRKLRFP